MSSWLRVVGPGAVIAMLALALLSGGRNATGTASRRPSVVQVRHDTARGLREPSSDVRHLIAAVDNRGLAIKLGSALARTRHGAPGFSLGSPRLIVSYNGVLALVFGGWPAAALDAKVVRM